MKRVVLNRKNSLFVGNPRGGRTAAILASLTSTCRRHDVDPQLYLTQLLTNLPQVRKSELPTGSRISGNCFRRHVGLRTTCPSHSAHISKQRVLHDYWDQFGTRKAVARIVAMCSDALRRL